MSILNEYAAIAAHKAAMGPEAHTPWSSLSEHDKQRWSKIAEAATGASPAPFVIECSIKTPGQSPIGHNTTLRLSGGAGDADIEIMADLFAQHLRRLRDE